MSKVLLLPHGTTGDVLPFIWLGRRLLERGHRVTMIWAEVFRVFAQRDGLARLGAGLSLEIALWTEERALTLLQRCLEDENIRHKAVECAQRIES